jgi:hypothetical protein
MDGLFEREAVYDKVLEKVSDVMTEFNQGAFPSVPDDIHKTTASLISPN